MDRWAPPRRAGGCFCVGQPRGGGGGGSKGSLSTDPVAAPTFSSLSSSCRACFSSSLPLCADRKARNLGHSWGALQAGGGQAARVAVGRSSVAKTTDRLHKKGFAWAQLPYTTASFVSQEREKDVRALTAAPRRPACPASSWARRSGRRARRRRPRTCPPENLQFMVGTNDENRLDSIRGGAGPHPPPPLGHLRLRLIRAAAARWTGP